ncbi:hypothetical protein EDF70_103386 [Neorhizobium sp. JUb45]|nr:hypothetical protein EDF70_103386 [Neorhizobium sp. JUb45]
MVWSWSRVFSSIAVEFYRFAISKTGGHMKPEQCAQPISPLEGEMSGRTEGGVSGTNAAFNPSAAPLFTPLCHSRDISPSRGEIEGSKRHRLTSICKGPQPAERSAGRSASTSTQITCPRPSPSGQYPHRSAQTHHRSSIHRPASGRYASRSPHKRCPTSASPAVSARLRMSSWWHPRTH